MIIMPKKCILCEESEAEFIVKGTSDSYCKGWAEEHFGDLSLLVNISEQDDFKESDEEEIN